MCFTEVDGIHQPFDPQRLHRNALAFGGSLPTGDTDDVAANSGIDRFKIITNESEFDVSGKLPVLHAVNISKAI